MVKSIFGELVIVVGSMCTQFIHPRVQVLIVDVEHTTPDSDASPSMRGVMPLWSTLAV